MLASPRDSDALRHPLYDSTILIFSMAVLVPYISIDPERGLRSISVNMNKQAIPEHSILKADTVLYVGKTSQIRLEAGESKLLKFIGIRPLVFFEHHIMANRTPKDLIASRSNLSFTCSIVDITEVRISNP